MNTQRLALDLSKRFDTKKTIFAGMGDVAGTTILATVTDGGLEADLTDMDATLKLPSGDIECVVGEGTVTCVLDESLVPFGAEDAYFSLTDGERTYSTQRFRIVTLAGYREA